MSLVMCGDCGAQAVLVMGSAVYPHREDLHHKSFWLCKCGAYCGTHKGTMKALGKPAGRATRAARIRAHAAFDPLWEAKMAREGVSKGKARRAGYKWLAAQLKMDPKACYVSMMSQIDCDRVTALCNRFHR